MSKRPFSANNITDYNRYYNNKDGLNNYKYARDHSSYYNNNVNKYL